MLPLKNIVFLDTSTITILSPLSIGTFNKHSSVEGAKYNKENNSEKPSVHKIDNF